MIRIYILLSLFVMGGRTNVEQVKVQFEVYNATISEILQYTGIVLLSAFLLYG